MTPSYRNPSLAIIFNRPTRETAYGGAVIVLGGGERGASASCENRDLSFFAGPKAAGVPN